MDEQQQQQQQPSTPDPITDAPKWTEPFQRTILACMVRKGLEVPTAAFGGGRTASPQQRIGAIINEYRAANGQPTIEIVDDLVRQEVERLGAAERTAVAQEWIWVAETEIPDDIGYVEGQVGLWSDYQNLKQVMFAAGDLLGTINQENLDAARELVTKAFAAVRTNGRSNTLQAVSLMDLLTLIPDAPEWVWEPFFAKQQFALVTAYTKIGKSTLAYPLAIAISRGEEFLGYPTRKTKVLILAVEEDARTVRQRLFRFGAFNEPTDIYVHYTRLNSEPAAMQEVRAFIKANEIGLVIVDTLSRFWRVKDENSNAEVQREAGLLLDLAQETGCCVLALHHDGRNENAKASRGASSLPGLAHVILRLKRGDRLSRQRTLETEGREDATPAKLIIELDDSNTWRRVEDVTEAPAVISDTDQVLAVLSKDNALSRRDIETKLNMSEKRTRAALTDLVSRGLAVVEGSNKATRYRLA